MKVALLVEYDGTDFAGWQVQPGQRTVQGELQAAFNSIIQSTIPVHGSGRTDAGVHARGIVAHVELPSSFAMSLEKLCEALNATSGRDVTVRDIRQVPDSFHARFSALNREYTYTIVKRLTSLERRTSWYVWADLDTESMRRCTLAIIGEHDFTSFSKRSDDVDHYRCIVDISDIEEVEERLYIKIRANRFVRGMVRSLVGAFVDVGKGKLSHQRFVELLHEPKEIDRAKYLVPAEGLLFCKVLYPREFGLWE